ncbi:hypothetical protein HDU76_004721 [Blyttiomyces sp. JEL0837]|nr:hypothetical protein HDU76_004721 [Blyttiomyces sp. JEL0837]
MATAWPNRKLDTTLNMDDDDNTFASSSHPRRSSPQTSSLPISSNQPPSVRSHPASGTATPPPANVAAAIASSNYSSSLSKIILPERLTSQLLRLLSNLPTLNNSNFNTIRNRMIPSSFMTSTPADIGTIEMEMDLATRLRQQQLLKQKQQLLNRKPRWIPKFLAFVSQVEGADKTYRVLVYALRLCAALLATDSAVWMSAGRSDHIAVKLLRLAAPIEEARMVFRMFGTLSAWESLTNGNGNGDGGGSADGVGVGVGLDPVGGSGDLGLDDDDLDLHDGNLNGPDGDRFGMDEITNMRNLDDTDSNVSTHRGYMSDDEGDNANDLEMQDVDGDEDDDGQGRDQDDDAASHYESSREWHGAPLRPQRLRSSSSTDRATDKGKGTVPRNAATARYQNGGASSTGKWNGKPQRPSRLGSDPTGSPNNDQTTDYSKQLRRQPTKSTKPIHIPSSSKTMPSSRPPPQRHQSRHRNPPIVSPLSSPDHLPPIPMTLPPIPTLSPTHAQSTTPTSFSDERFLKSLRTWQKVMLLLYYPLEHLYFMAYHKVIGFRPPPPPAPRKPPASLSAFRASSSAALQAFSAPHHHVHRLFQPKNDHASSSSVHVPKQPPPPIIISQPQQQLPPHHQSVAAFSVQRTRDLYRWASMAWLAYLLLEFTAVARAMSATAKAAATVRRQRRLLRHRARWSWESLVGDALDFGAGAFGVDGWWWAGNTGGGRGGVRQGGGLGGLGISNGATSDGDLSPGANLGDGSNAPPRVDETSASMIEHGMLEDELRSLNSEMRNHWLRLVGLFGDLPLAINGSLASHPLPLWVIGFCGTVSSLAAWRLRWKYMVDFIDVD